jgi:hypothetical protein
MHDVGGGWLTSSQRRHPERQTGRSFASTSPPSFIWPPRYWRVRSICWDSDPVHPKLGAVSLADCLLRLLHDPSVPPASDLCGLSERFFADSRWHQGSLPILRG